MAPVLQSLPVRLAPVPLSAGAFGLCAGVLVAAPVITATSRVHPSVPSWLYALLAFGLGAVIARAADRRRPRTFAALALSGFVVGIAVFTVRSATYPLAWQLGSAISGVATAFLPLSLERYRGASAVAVVAAAGVVLVWLEPPAVAASLAAVTAVVGIATGRNRDDESAGARSDFRPAMLWCGLALAAMTWVGATNPAASWLGPVTSHGSGDRRLVALTFDDGPNGDVTLDVLRILDGRGVKGTFFLVGKAVHRQPETAARIIADGHLVGNHSFSHDGWRYLQPAYPELDRGQQAIIEAAGACPRYYRPPHGTHTPFVWFAARRHGMRITNWDVSAHDWDATDPDELARRLVDGAHPGSILLLHDGLDGKEGVDRAVLSAALPRIIDGLRARGLEPVRLDVLLGEDGYLPSCARR
jgi:peptidoglycan/xylan/chitin deacetylase (PgdA/CDA1 family)